MNYTNTAICSPREQVIRNVMALIRERELPPDAEVPAENLLAERFGVSRGTVRSGLAVLAERGVLEKRGRRMHVVPKPKGSGSSLMNRTIILLGPSDKDDAIRKRNSGFMDAIQAGALEEVMARNMHSLWLNASQLHGGELEELAQIRPAGRCCSLRLIRLRPSTRRPGSWRHPGFRWFPRFTARSTRRSTMCCPTTPKARSC